MTTAKMKARLAQAERFAAEMKGSREQSANTVSAMRAELLLAELRGEVRWRPVAAPTADPPQVAAMRTELLAEVARHCR